MIETPQPREPGSGGENGQSRMESTVPDHLFLVTFVDSILAVNVDCQRKIARHSTNRLVFQARDMALRKDACGMALRRSDGVFVAKNDQSLDQQHT